MSDGDPFITVDVDPSEIAQIAQEDLDLTIASETKSMEGMTASDARAWIDTRTRNLQRSISALIAIRNTLAPINNLPDEMIVEIFWNLATEVPLPRFDIGVAPWLVISNVCRRWRNIVVGTPKLYSCVDVRSIRVVRLFLARSHQVPLDIYMPTDKLYSHVYAVMTDVMHHIHRIRTFDIRAGHQGLQAFLKHADSLPAPALESIYLRQSTLRRVLTPHQTIISYNLFGGRTPALRRICLAHVCIPWTSPIYKGLTDLELSFEHESITPTVEVFVQVLQNCPLLKSLVLVFAGPTLHASIREYPLPSRMVELPHLKTVYLELSRPIDHQYLLAHMITPPHAFISLRCALTHSNQNIPDVLPRDCTGLQGLQTTRCIMLHAEDIRSILLVGSRHDHSTVLQILLGLEINDGILKPRQTFSHLEHFFPLPCLEELQMVDCAAFMSKDNFVRLFSKLPSLICLSASESAPARQRQLLAALTMPPVGESEGVVCPRMEVLRLTGLNLAPEVVKAIADICSYRAVNGAALKTIQINDLSAEDVSSLIQLRVSISH